MSKGSAALAWFLAVLCAAALLVYQRRTGPTYPISIQDSVGTASVSGKLIRTHETTGPARIALTVTPAAVGTLVWRRFPTDDPWTRVPMTPQGGELGADLPTLPAAGKVEYVVELRDGEKSVTLPRDGTAILRYKGAVPGWLLIAHVVLIFLGPIFAFRAAFGRLFGDEHAGRWLVWLLAAMVAGGFWLGPWMQKYAFDAYWTGWPVGEDLTDTKTLVAIAGWTVAWYAERWRKSWRTTAFWAALALMLVVFLVPHSVRGSQIDWAQHDAAPAGPQRPSR